MPAGMKSLVVPMSAWDEIRKIPTQNAELHRRGAKASWFAATASAAMACCWLPLAAWRVFYWSDWPGALPYLVTGIFMAATAGFEWHRVRLQRWLAGLSERMSEDMAGLGRERPTDANKHPGGSNVQDPDHHDGQGNEPSVTGVSAECGTTHRPAPEAAHRCACGRNA